MPTSSDRLQRLLALVPYVVSRKVVGLAETAAAFGVSERELVDDLNMLWCVELRAPDPYCPIDLSYEGGEIMVSQAEAMDRPLRLGVDEASALLVALRMLAELGLARFPPARRLGAEPDHRETGGRGREAAAPSVQVAVQVDRDAEGSVLAQVRDALDWAGGCTCPTTSPAGTRRPSGTWTRCGCCSWRAGPTWRRGAAGPRRSGCSGWIGCSG